jgi:predicted Zn-dependent protease with MMP-like domain
MARVDQTGDWAERLSPSLTEFESMALEAYAHLPEEFRELVGDIIIEITDFPEETIADDLGLETPFDILGLFEGKGAAELWTPQASEGPNKITLYRRAILDYWCENEEALGTIIAHVLIHEIGHHFGLEEDGIEALEASAG